MSDYEVIATNEVGTQIIVTIKGGLATDADKRHLIIAVERLVEGDLRHLASTKLTYEVLDNLRVRNLGKEAA